jgi:hypothetical protein
VQVAFVAQVNGQGRTAWIAVGRRLPVGVLDDLGGAVDGGRDQLFGVAFAALESDGR